MTFHSIVREWCRTYKGMLDSPSNRRFYLTDSAAGVVEMAKGIPNTFSPCVIMESSIEGGGPFMKPSRNYPIYFFVKADKQKDGDEATAAKEEAWVHAQNFLTWLYVKHEKELETNRSGDYARIDLENISLDVTTVGPLENGWFGILVQFERMEPISTCVDDNLYIELDC